MIKQKIFSVNNHFFTSYNYLKKQKASTTLA